MELLTKKCSRCKEEKSVDEFNSFSTMNKNGLKLRKSSYCYSCQSKIDKEKYIKNKPKYIKKAKEWKAKNRDRVNELNRKYKDKNRKEPKSLKYKNKYGEVPDIGTVFGKWSVIDNSVVLIGKKPRRVRAVNCKCECGTIKLVRLDSLFQGKSKGCYCISGEAARVRRKNESVGMLSRTQFAYFKNCAIRRDISWELKM